MTKEQPNFRKEDLISLMKIVFYSALILGCTFLFFWLMSIAITAAR